MNFPSFDMLSILCSVLEEHVHAQTYVDTFQLSVLYKEKNHSQKKKNLWFCTVINVNNYYNEQFH